jgi:hypothetical protein
MLFGWFKKIPLKQGLSYTVFPYEFGKIAYPYSDQVIESYEGEFDEKWEGV